MKKEKKSHFNLWIYVIIIVCILSSSIAYSALNASVKITGDVVIEKKLFLYDKVKENAVMDNIKSTYVSSTTGINFKEISSNTNGKGVYIRAGTEKQQYPIYYYRGAVDNNYVLFANYCWKIVRTTETGGIKLIYSGKSSTDGKSCIVQPPFKALSFNTSDNSPAYVGYKYGTVYPINSEKNPDGVLFGSDVSYSGGQYTLTNISAGNLDDTHHYSCANGLTCSVVRYYFYLLGADGGSGTGYYIELKNGEKIENALANMLDKNVTNSTIKDYIENEWYKNNMTSYSDSLEDTEWCNDRSIYQKGGWDPQGKLTTLIFGGEGRLQNGTPNLTCPRETDKLTVANGGVKYKTGLLTVDEAMLAGVNGSDDNENTYLYFPWASGIWLMSPGEAWYYVSEEDIWGSHNIDNDGVSNTLAAYPVVSLKNDSSITGGNGTEGSPYIIN